MLAVSGLLSAQAHAQAGPRILVLTTDEGQPGDTNTFEQDGKDASDNLARAFGNGTAFISPAPQVKYLYGALSIRSTKAGDVIAARPNTDDSLYPSTATNTVRVVDSAGTAVDPATGLTTGANERVVYVPDSRPRLDSANLAAIFKPDDAERYDLVVIGSTYRKVTDEAYQTLAALMQNPALKPRAVLFFVDSCCDGVIRAP
ncbi:hypothetical protein [Diaphorobacter aerolatus]|uniref:Uncharacterized protein n=1 Tax=Diaphorobacter aerolatus TaxID=1288495 RepID=A0A7H0GPR1_9BURK|nr:hypothetical protein [Diaphorobacter aerolatus]QNP50277.1 hypothetical protein H9K75_11120 [Diaphorobacter aerolatus]